MLIRLIIYPVACDLLGIVSKITAGPVNRSRHSYKYCRFLLPLICLYITSRGFKCEIIDTFGRITDYKKHLQTKRNLVAIKYKVLNQSDVVLFNRTKNHDGYSDFKNKIFSKFTNETSVFVKITKGIQRNQFGNYFGVILNDYACASVSGAHFILVIDPVERMDDFNFVDFLPAVIVHQHPKSLDEAVNISRKRCGFYPFPWKESRGTVLNDEAAVVTIRKIVHQSITNIYTSLLKSTSSLSQLTPHLSSISDNKSHPDVSDVAVHYRCSDNIRVETYGLLPFEAFLNVIPSYAEYIYVHTEGTDEPNHICTDIINSFYHFLTRHFPDSNVLVFTRINVFVAMHDFIHSHLRLICSSSTFCLHAAIGKTVGEVYLPAGGWYGGWSRFGYHSWYYLPQKSKWQWPDEVLNNRSLLIAALKNQTLFYAL